MPKEIVYTRSDIDIPQEQQFDFFIAQKGKIYRDLNNRKTHEIELNGKSYFIKIHLGVGWREVLKNIVQFKAPIIGAHNEWKAIQKLHHIGVPTMELAAYGKKGYSPATLQSFVMTDALQHTESLEDFCPRFFQEPLTPEKLRFKRALIRKIAWTARQLHQHRMIHCDLYICHFHIDLSMGEENLTCDNIKLHVIDLHRVRFSPLRPHRWIIKDLAAIYFSSLDLPLERSDLIRFAKHYHQAPLKDIVRKYSRFWKRVENRAFQLYRKDHGKTAANESKLRLFYSGF